MGCFSIFPCFTSSKHPKVPNKYANPPTPTEESTNIRTPVLKSRVYSEGQVINDSHNKDFSIQDVEIEIEILSVESKEDKQIENEIKKEKQNNERVHVEIENGNKIETEPKQENQSFGVNVDLENGSDKEKEVKTEVDISDSSASSYISYPPMHRYNNSIIKEDEDQVVIQQDSSESLFSIDPRRQSKTCPIEVEDKEVNSPLKTDSLLNPIENLAQWKTIKTTPSLDLHQEKENLYLEQEDITIPISEDPSFKVLDVKGKVKNNTAVTTSLSSWLVDPEKSITVSNQEESQYSTGNSYAYSDGATSWKSFEDRPILGAWTIDEVKQISARSSPRKSPRRNPDETPIIGTVGSYWSHTIQATDSSSSCTSPFGRSANSRRNRENKGLSCHSSPTKRRLERAFNKSGV